MKLIIAGGRHYQLTTEDFVKLENLHKEIHITEVVSGKCRGADSGGETWAKVNKIHVEPFPADWDRYTRGSAGPIRNRQMAQYADAVVLFPGDSGTASMCREAKIAEIKIYDWRESE